MYPHIEKASDDESDNPIVTFIINNRVIPGKEASFEKFLKDINKKAMTYPGHMGVNFIRPGPNEHTYTTIVRFDNYEHLHDWLESPARKEYMKNIEDLVESDPEIKIETGLEYWFTPLAVDAKTPKRWKQFVITLSAIYPLTLLLGMFFSLFDPQSMFVTEPLLNRLLGSFLLVFMMVYVVMPGYTRLVSKWLYK